MTEATRSGYFDFSCGWAMIMNTFHTLFHIPPPPFNLRNQKIPLKNPSQWSCVVYMIYNLHKLLSFFLRRPCIIRTRRVWRYQRGNQNPYIEEEQTTQWPKEKVQKGKQRSKKHTHKTKDRVTRTPLKFSVLFIVCKGKIPNEIGFDFNSRKPNESHSISNQVFLTDNIHVRISNFVK